MYNSRIFCRNCVPSDVIEFFHVEDARRGMMKGSSSRVLFYLAVLSEATLPT